MKVIEFTNVAQDFQPDSLVGVVTLEYCAMVDWMSYRTFSALYRDSEILWTYHSLFCLECKRVVL